MADVSGSVSGSMYLTYTGSDWNHIKELNMSTPKGNFVAGDHQAYGFEAEELISGSYRVGALYKCSQILEEGWVVTASVVPADVYTSLLVIDNEDGDTLSITADGIRKNGNDSILLEDDGTVIISSLLSSGSLEGTASYADDAMSASYALSASYVESASYALSASYSVTSSYSLRTQPVRGITTKTSSYTASDNEYTIVADGSTQAVTITLPLIPSTGSVKNVSCLNSSHSVYIDFNGKNFYDSTTSESLYKGENLTIQFNGSEWIGV